MVPLQQDGGGGPSLPVGPSIARSIHTVPPTVAYPHRGSLPSRVAFTDAPARLASGQCSPPACNSARAPQRLPATSGSATVTAFSATPPFRIAGPSTPGTAAGLPAQQPLSGALSPMVFAPAGSGRLLVPARHSQASCGDAGRAQLLQRRTTAVELPSSGKHIGGTSLAEDAVQAPLASSSDAARCSSRGSRLLMTLPTPRSVSPTREVSYETSTSLSGPLRPPWTVGEAVPTVLRSVSHGSVHAPSPGLPSYVRVQSPPREKASSSLPQPQRQTSMVDGRSLSRSQQVMEPETPREARQSVSPDRSTHAASPLRAGHYATGYIPVARLSSPSSGNHPCGEVSPSWASQLLGRQPTAPPSSRETSGIASPGWGGHSMLLNGILEVEETEGKKINWQPLSTEEDLKAVEPTTPSAGAVAMTPSMSGSAASVSSTVLRNANCPSSVLGRPAVCSSDETLGLPSEVDWHGRRPCPTPEAIAFEHDTEAVVEPLPGSASVSKRVGCSCEDQGGQPQLTEQCSAPSVNMAAESTMEMRAVEVEGEMNMNTEPNLRSLVGRFGCPSIPRVALQDRQPTEAPAAEVEGAATAIGTEVLGQQADGVHDRSQMLESPRLRNLQADRLEYQKERQVGSPKPLQARANPLKTLSGSHFVPLGMPLSARGTESRPKPSVELAVFEVQASGSQVRAEDLSELKMMRKPPHQACQVLEAIAIALGFSDIGWGSVRRRLDAALVQRLASFDAAAASSLPLGKALRFLELVSSPDFSEKESQRDRCPAIPSLARWCGAVAGLLARIQERIASESGSATLPRASSLPPASKGSEDAAISWDRSPRSPRKDANCVPRSPVNHKGDLKPSKAVSRRQGRGQSPVSPRNLSKPELLGDYSVDPALWRLSEVEQSVVKELRVSREGYGHITFHGVTNCRGLLEQLRNLVVIERGEVILYPDSSLKPPAGQGLNKEASIVLYGCMPKSQDRLLQHRRQDRYRQRVAQMTEEKGAIFEDYNCEDGTWKFRVRHF
mmetsp:Transcript_51976/g.121721  ORF Transcript_51976/g.121721 Transcript_51976/m.121721 type:complete len:1011 (-) Transcript_51976:93-3125(-)